MKKETEEYIMQIEKLVEVLERFNENVEKIIAYDAKNNKSAGKPASEEGKSSPASSGKKKTTTRRGRPPGSKNKAKITTPAKTEQNSDVEPEHSMDELVELVSENLEADGFKEAIKEMLARNGLKKVTNVLPENQDNLYEQIKDIVDLYAAEDEDEDEDEDGDLI